MSAVTDYLRDIEQALKAGNATEHTHRPALKTLIEAVRPKITATNEPRRIKCGAPDFIVTEKVVPLGYVEAKDVGLDLDKTEDGPQLKRYRESLRNLILTDYLEFRLYRNGEHVQTVRLAKWQKNNVLRREPGAEGELITLFGAFFDAQAPSISNPRDLAERMARMARLIHDLIRQAFVEEGQTGDLHAQYEAFQRVLISGLSPDQFADMYAQTIAYGLFAARCNHTSDGFTRERAGHDLPKTNPFLRRLFNTIAGADLDERIAWAVDDLADLLAKADIAAILKNFGKSTRQDDPIVHFYETFLAAYDPKLREMRGVYYTPEPIVDYITRSVDLILKRDFKLKDGLADVSKVKLKRKRAALKGGGLVEETYETHRVQVLDPACGTGTFLHAIFANVRERFAGNAGLWPGYVAEHLLPRIYGFELLMAPYAVTHMKLGLQLRESGYDFTSDERLRVYLTNTLEEAHEMTGLPLFTQWLADEAAAAGEVKKNAPIMVVVGNPPYSGHSANKGAWIKGLIEDYKRSPALRKPAQGKWLSDDYVKFLRFAHWRIEQTGYGVLAFITNHSYLDNPTFMDMRSSLMAGFDDLYILDLHGNSKRKERTPDGGRDENVFDIMQGVAIALFVRRTTRAGSTTVRRADLWGEREKKYAWLASHDVTNTPWEEITPAQAPWFFVKQDMDLLAEYERGWSVADIFNLNGSPAPGIVTTHDQFAISWTPTEAATKVETLLSTSSEDEARRHFRLCTQEQWNYERAKAVLTDGAWREQVVPILYRPFDVRWTVWNSHVSVHRRERVMRHMTNGDNLGLIIDRQVNGDFYHALITDKIINDCTLSNKTKERSYLLPLYLMEEGETFFGKDERRVNLNPDFLAALNGVANSSELPPEDILGYIYASLYAPSYRLKYADFLKRNFPRVPLPESAERFAVLSALGRELMDVHLMQKILAPITSYPQAGNSKVECVDFVVDENDESVGLLRINAEQYFGDVPVGVWEYEIGGYQVAHKWLNDRKGRMLTFDDLQKYSQIIAILQETIRLQEEIDEVLAAAS